uniref:Lebercilin LCA5 n=1 Tax=Lates calcarifer TaxID=8187 RepID=A0A4W6E0H2_LATCA
MESENATDLYEDNRDVNLSHRSLRSTKKDSRASSIKKHKKNFRDKIQDEDEKDSCVESRSKTRTWHSDPDRDQISDGEGRRSTGSFYSEDYENESPSDRSLSSYSRGLSRPPRPGGQPLTQQQRRGGRSQSKESTPPKDLDLVTKRMLSARLLKINELRNALAELQQRTDELQKENRVLRQLQVRQEKALQRYDDTESEISQLLARHSNETHVLRERLRRTQERERVAERRLKDSEEQLQRSLGTIARLKKLVDQRELGARDELSRRLEEEKARAQEAERKIKELERSLELSNSSYQRQLAAERKKTVSAQEEIRALQEELERLTNKLKEKERELDARNIYANRMGKVSLRKDTESCTKRKGKTLLLVEAHFCNCLEFTCVFIAKLNNEYILLLWLWRTWNSPKKFCADEACCSACSWIQEREKQQLNQELNVLEEKAKRLRDGKDKKRKRNLLILYVYRLGEGNGGRRQKEDKFPVEPEGGREQEEVRSCPGGGAEVEPGGFGQSASSRRSTSQERTAAG